MTFIKGVKTVSTILYLVFIASFSVLVFLDVSLTREDNFNVRHHVVFSCNFKSNNTNLILTFYYFNTKILQIKLC
jgi:hypothetical protein